MKERMTAAECDERAREWITAVQGQEGTDCVAVALLALYWQREAERAERREEGR
jgi:hypothetical protein